MSSNHSMISPPCLRVRRSFSTSGSRAACGDAQNASCRGVPCAAEVSIRSVPPARSPGGRPPSGLVVLPAFGPVGGRPTSQDLASGFTAFWHGPYRLFAFSFRSIQVAADPSRGQLSHNSSGNRRRQEACRIAFTLLGLLRGEWCGPSPRPPILRHYREPADRRSH